jgi:hypothetical protein
VRDYRQAEHMVAADKNYAAPQQLVYPPIIMRKARASFEWLHARPIAPGTAPTEEICRGKFSLETLFLR